MINKHLEVLNNDFTIYKYDANETIPEGVYKSNFYWIGKTDEELSIVCESGLLPIHDTSNNNWSIIRIAEKLDFSLAGILAEITNALKNAGISIIALSTYNTDYIMLKKEKLKEAKAALKNTGYKFI
jgi:uncharacterized protein